jgi:hypothetical protein
MKAFFESLESRSLLSVSPSFAGPTPPQSGEVIYSTLAVLPSVLGTWKGTLTLPGVHSKTVKIRINAQTHTGKVSGILTTTQDPSIRVTVTGKVTSTGRLYLTLAGGHGGGAINGTGNGKLKVGNTKVTLAMVFTQNGANYDGTISLHKV